MKWLQKNNSLTVRKLLSFFHTQLSKNPLNIDKKNTFFKCNKFLLSFDADLFSSKQLFLEPTSHTLKKFSTWQHPDLLFPFLAKNAIKKSLNRLDWQFFLCIYSFLKFLHSMEMQWVNKNSIYNTYFFTATSFMERNQLFKPTNTLKISFDFKLPAWLHSFSNLVFRFPRHFQASFLLKTWWYYWL